MLTKRTLFAAGLILCGLPGLALVWAQAGAFLEQAFGNGEAWLQGLALGLGLVSLAAWRLNQTRLVFVAVSLFCSAVWLWSRLSLDAHDAIATEDAWLFAWPAGLALALLPREAVLFSRRSAGRLALLALPALLLWAAASADGVATAQLLNWRAWGAHASAQPSHGAHLSAALLLLVLWRGADAKLGPAQAALAGTLLGQVLLAWITRWHPGGGAIEARTWLLSHCLQAALLALALFYMYWQRVYLDELTGIPNRRALDERLLHLEAPWSLAMVDIDHFKKFNDTYGHDQGDDVLRLVGQHLAAGTQGRAFRYGGEEFCVVLPGIGTAETEGLMDGVREDLGRTRFSIRLPPNIRKKTGPRDRGSLHVPAQMAQVTISVGVAGPDGKRPEPADVLKLADQGLYKAKENGRNNVVRMN